MWGDSVEEAVRSDVERVEVLGLRVEAGPVTLV